MKNVMTFTHYLCLPNVLLLPSSIYFSAVVLEDLQAMVAASQLAHIA